MTDEELKVNDKRMFTADGELREEFRHLDESPGGGAATAEPASDPPVEAEPPARESQSGPIIPASEPAGTPAESAPLENEMGAAPEQGELSILDLVGLLAEHTALYLGEASLPDGQSVRDLRAAKMHVDLLDVLRRKTAGNLTAQESSVLEDILYRLRMLYVEKMRQGE